MLIYNSILSPYMNLKYQWIITPLRLPSPSLRQKLFIYDHIISTIFKYFKYHYSVTFLLCYTIIYR